MKIQLGMGGKIHAIQVESHHRKGERFSSVIAVADNKGTCEDFNQLFCCMVALGINDYNFTPLQLNITNNHETAGFTGVWLARKFRSHKAAIEFVAETQNRIDDYLREVAGACRITVAEVLSREANFPTA